MKLETTVIEQLLKTNGRAILEDTMDRHTYETRALKTGDTYTTPNGIKCTVIESRFYEDSNLVITRLAKIN